MLKRSQMIHVHMLLAALVLPVLLMYLISGMLYTFDVKGHIKKQKIDIILAQPVPLRLDALAAITEKSLLQHHLPIPEGEMSLKKKKTSYLFRWGDLKYAVSVKTTKNPKVLKMTVRERNFLTQVMRIHRAEAGVIFKVIPSILLIGMLLVLLSGIYMALSIPKFRKPVLYSMGCSTGLFLIIFMV